MFNVRFLQVTAAFGMISFLLGLGSTALATPPSCLQEEGDHMVTFEQLDGSYQQFRLPAGTGLEALGMDWILSKGRHWESSSIGIRREGLRGLLTSHSWEGVGDPPAAPAETIEQFGCDF